MCTADNSWWWAQKMPETCRVSWDNKFWIFDASSWLFHTKLITMHGHLNIKMYSQFGSWSLVLWNIISCFSVRRKVDQRLRSCFQAHLHRHTNFFPLLILPTSVPPASKLWRYSFRTHTVCSEFCMTCRQDSDYDSKPDCPINFGKKLLCFRRGSNFEFLSVI
jgi:hypothetical protein